MMKMKPNYFNLLLTLILLMLFNFDAIMWNLTVSYVQLLITTDMYHEDFVFVFYDALYASIPFLLTHAIFTRMDSPSLKTKRLLFFAFSGTFRRDFVLKPFALKTYLPLLPAVTEAACSCLLFVCVVVHCEITKRLNTIKKVSLLPRVAPDRYKTVEGYDFVWQMPQYAVPVGARVNDFTHLVSVYCNGGLFNYLWDHLNINATDADSDIYYLWAVVVPSIAVYVISVAHPDDTLRLIPKILLVECLPYIIFIYIEFTRPQGRARRSNANENWATLGWAVVFYFIIDICNSISF